MSLVSWLNKIGEIQREKMRRSIRESAEETYVELEKARSTGNYDYEKIQSLEAQYARLSNEATRYGIKINGYVPKGVLD